MIVYGMLTTIKVPFFSSELNATLPFRRSTLDFIFLIPIPSFLAFVLKPIPSSLIVRCMELSSLFNITFTLLALAYLFIF